MTHAAPPPAGDEEMEHILYVRHGLAGDWSSLIAAIRGWLAYERDLTRYTIDSKLKAEHERAIEEAAQCCDVLGEKLQASPAFNTMAGWCADAIRALKVVAGWCADAIRALKVVP